MFATERQKGIHLYLVKHHMATIRDLAKEFDVSETTIRRDLEVMEKSGLIKKTFGGAIAVDGSVTYPPYQMREKGQSDVKRSLGALACKLIRDGELLFLDSSSTVNGMVGNSRFYEREHLVVISSNIKTAMQLSSHGNITVYCTGGVMRVNTNSMVGAHTERFYDNFYADIAFVSCSGLDLSLGITEASEDEAQIKRKIYSRARKIALICDASKIGKSYSSFVADISRIDFLITDHVFTESDIHLLQQKQVRVIQ